MKPLAFVLFFVIQAICADVCKNWSDIQSNTPSKTKGGDFNSSAREYPHMAALGFYSLSGNPENSDVAEWLCGGTLISDKFILTAASCVKSIQGPPIIVRLGDYNLKTTTDDAKPEDYKIKRIISHPDFSRLSKQNDIALIELTNTVTFNDYVKPACLQSNEQILNKNWIVTGWSALEFSGNQQPVHLQKFYVKQFTNEECNKFYNKLEYGVIEKQVCAGDDNAVMCEGIGGGPLQVKNDFGSYNIIGVSSFGQACSIKPVIPDIFTRVSAYMEWIESIVWPK